MFLFFGNEYTSLSAWPIFQPFLSILFSLRLSHTNFHHHSPSTYFQLLLNYLTTVVVIISNSDLDNLRAITTIKKIVENLFLISPQNFRFPRPDLPHFNYSDYLNEINISLKIALKDYHHLLQALNLRSGQPSSEI